MTGLNDDAFQAFVDDPAAAVRRWTEPLHAEVAQLRVQSARDRVMAAMDADPELGSKWRAINADAAFVRWLSEADLLTGARRLDLLLRAFDLGDADRVRAFFAAWARPRTPATKTAAPGSFDPRARQPAVRADAVGKRTYTRADIAKFYSDRRAGLYDGREAEALRIERDIVAAAAGNRVSDPPMRMDP